ncbi:MAG TPA: hypothetical protein VIT68_02135, partial [Candidatus Gracilibacteria bacterium]
PYAVIRIQHLYLLVGYSLLPFIFLFAVRLTEDFTHISKTTKTYELKNQRLGLWAQKLKKIRKEHLQNTTSQDKIICSLISFALLWAMAVGAVHYLFFAFFLVAFWGIYRLSRYALQGRYEEFIQVIIRLSLGGFLTLLLVSYYLFPYIAASGVDAIAPPNINSIDSLDMVSRNNLPHLVLYLISYWWGLFDFNALPLSFWIGGGLLFSTMALAILFRIHNKFVLFASGFCLWAFAMSFGTKWVPELFLWFVFKGPLAGPIGFIFRDGNKFVGLLAFGMAILLGYGIISIFELLTRLKNEREKAKNKKSFLSYFSLLMVLAVIVFTGSLHYYFKPVHKLYFEHLYYPNPIPQSYEKTRDFLDENQDEGLQRTLMMPRYEMLVTPGYGYCVSTWNARKTEDKNIPPRATSSLDLWSLNQRTYHPQEGATVFWHTLHDYFFEMLGEGKSSNVGKFIARLGINRIAFHNDILGYEKWLDGVSDNLQKQEYLEPMEDGNIGFFQIFKVKSVDWAHVYARNLLSFSGLSIIDPLLYLPEFKNQETAFFFATQNSQSADLQKLNPGDIIQVSNKNDVILSQIDKKYFLHPFDATLYGNPYYRWAKLRTDTPDWSWQLKSLNIPSEKREFDFGKGIAYTFVPKMLEIDPYEDFSNFGIPYNFAAYLDKDEELLASDVPEVLTIQEGFTHTYDRLPSAFGKSTAGDSEFWRVAKTKKLPAKANNGYFFELVMSGTDTHKIHAKVKFYDAAEEEVGVAYVSAPKEVETFDFIKFKGLYVTPPETESLQVEILSLQNPEVKSIWVLHDFTLLDLENITAPNTLSFDYKAEESDIYDVYVRAFDNKKGGRMVFRIDGDQEEPKIFATQNPFQNEFKWYSLGSLSLQKGQKYKLDFENLEGVNALNLIAVVPQGHRLAIERSFGETMQNFHQMVLLESDIDFEILGHKQLETNDPQLSNGKGVSLGSGFLRTDFEIVKEGDYQVRLRAKMFDELKKRSDKELTTYIQDKATGKTIYHETLDLFGTFERMKWFELPSLHLDEGAYQLRIEFKDNAPSLLTVKDFREWREEEFFFTLGDKEKNPSLCSPYVDAGPQPLKLFTHDKSMEGIVDISASCDWISTVSEPLSVKAGEQYFMSFEIAVQNNHKLHFKALYFDRDRKLIESKNFNFPESENYPSFRIEEILKIPENVRFMQLQILTRPHPERNTRFIVRDFTIKNFDQFPLLDIVNL